MADPLIAITIPDFGKDVKKVTIVEWLKRPGDSVQAEEVILEVMTDKVNMEVGSPATGTIAKILFDKDAVVDVGTIVGELSASN